MQAPGEPVRKGLVWTLAAAVLLGTAFVWFGGAAGATPTAATDEQKSHPAFDWQSLGGPYERVAFALVYDPESWLLYAGTLGHGLYSSWNGGETWEPANPGEMPYVRTLSTLPSLPGALLVGTYLQGLYYSEDGSRWTQLGGSGPLSRPKSAEHPARSPRNVESLLVYQRGMAERVLVGTHNGIVAGYVASDTWSHLTAGFKDTDDAYYIHALARDRAGRLYAGTRDGLYVSEDDGEMWRRTAPPERADEKERNILSLAVVTGTHDADGTLLVGTAGAGIYSLVDADAETWQERNRGVPTPTDARRIQAMLALQDGRVYAGTVDHGALLSTDGGESWTQIVTGLPPTATSTTVFAWDPVSSTLYAGTYGDGVYRMGPGDTAWQAANEGLPVDFDVQEIAFAGPEGHSLLAGLRVGGLYSYEFEGGDRWYHLPDALPVGPARDVAGLVVTGKDRETAVVASSVGIFRRVGAGGKWQRLGSVAGLPEGESQARALAQGRENRQVLYAALDSGDGVYRSDDGGATWQSAAGSLDESLRTKACCLAIGQADQVVYLGLSPEEGTVDLPGQSTSIFTRSVFVSHDGGAMWQPLAALEGETLEELAWSRRGGFEVFWYGGEREMLYARTQEGIYASYDEGASWELRLRGLFRDVTADPFRPWMVYAAAADVDLTKEFEQTIELASAFWVSYDGGVTWTWAGTGPVVPTQAEPASITILTFNPEDDELLYAGTQSAGVLFAPVPSRARPWMPRAFALLLLFVLTVGAIVLMIDTWWRFSHRNGLPPLTAPGLAVLRIVRHRHVRLIAEEDTRLTPLECMALALAPGRTFAADAVWKAFNREEMPVELDEIRRVLDQCTARYQLLRLRDQGYERSSVLLGRLAYARFWDNQHRRDGLIKEIQSQSRFRADIRHFFRMAGFEAFAFEGGFRIASNLPEYALLGADRGIYVHAFTTAGEAVPVEEAREGAYRAYDTRLSSRIAFLIVSCCPRLQDLRELIHLREREGLRPVLLPYGYVRGVREARDARQLLDRTLRRSLGDADLFDLSEAADNPLDFWGRERDLAGLLSACARGEVVGVTGMAKVGKTSIGLQMMDRLPGSLTAWVQRDRPPGWDLYAALYEEWLVQARARFHNWEQPQQDPPEGRHTSEEIRSHLANLRASLAEQSAGVQLVAVVDGLPGAAASWEPLTTLAQAIGATPGASLLCIFQRPVQVDGVQPVRLLPFGQEEGAEMVQILAAQMGFEFEVQAMTRLHELAGGHPLILRQLASRAVLDHRGSEPIIDAAGVQRAAEWYVSQSSTGLHELWNSLLEGEQQVLWMVARGEPPPPGQSLERLHELGWLRADNGDWALFSAALARWIRAHPPHR